jgi:activator of HSP90 ATPase
MKYYRKYYSIPASTDDVFTALTNPVTLQLWTGEQAEMSTDPGSEFSLWDGNIVGKNLEFEPGKKIVQQWYFGEESEESVVTILLHPKGTGTSVELQHTNIPDEDYDDITDGWDNYYFGALREFYKE